MQRHLRFTPLLGACLMLASVLVQAQETKTDKEPIKEKKSPNYYPLQVGNRWTYRVTVEGSADKGIANTGKAVSSIVKIENSNGVPLARLEATVKDPKDSSDKVVAIEHLLQTDKGVFRHRLNDKELSPPLKLLQYPVKAGDKWQGGLSIEKEAGKDKETGKYYCETSEEQVKVPAGSFKALKVAIKLETEEGGETRVAARTTYWFVEHKGFVKQTLKTETLDMTMELEKFEPAKKEKKEK